MANGNRDETARAYREYRNRKGFSYDPAQDPLYRAYRDMYTESARQASLSAQGQAAALTGGYGNSYAASAGNAAYGQAMTGLNEKLMSLYDRAYGRWQNEGTRLKDVYQMAADEDEKSYARDKDARDEEYRRRAYIDARDDEMYKRQSDEREQAYQLALLLGQGGVDPGSGLALRAGLTDEDRENLLRLYGKKKKTVIVQAQPKAAEPAKKIVSTYKGGANR